MRQIVSSRKQLRWDNPLAAVQPLLRDPERPYATTLLVLALDCFGKECLDWHPETMQLEMKDSFGVYLPKENLDKLYAGITLLTTDYFYQSVSRFIDLANVLAGDDFDPEVFNPADVDECSWAVAEALLLSPPEPDEPQPFCTDIQQYIAYVLREEAFAKPPSILRVAVAPDLPDKLQYDYGTTDDPDMFSATYQRNAEKADQVDQMVLENLYELFQQLQGLPLQNGKTQGLLEALQAQYRQLREVSSSPRR